jgi:uncharacterized protein YcbX
MPVLSRIAIHPIKALDPVPLDRISITDVGGLTGDRVYGIVDESGDYIHGKRTADVHRLNTEFDLDTAHLRLRVRGEDRVHEFNVDRNREALEAWLSNYFDTRIELEAGPGGSQTDSVVYTDEAEAGPTLISAATIREVASWYDGIGPDEMRLRLRPNLVVEGVPPFWEDKLVAEGGCDFRIGDVTLEGLMPVPRCVVPTRDPYTGEVYERFRETFLEKREETLPEWADQDAFDGNLFSLMAVARIPETDYGSELSIGDPVHLIDAAIEE